MAFTMNIALGQPSTCQKLRITYYTLSGKKPLHLVTATRVQRHAGKCMLKVPQRKWLLQGLLSSDSSAQAHGHQILKGAVRREVKWH